jgi:hypothetical protein
MKPRKKSARALIALLSLGAGGCAKGATAEPLQFESGVYELLTVKVDGDCAPDGAITPGDEQIGKLARVAADVNDRRMQLEVCNDFFDDDCIPDGLADPLTFLRDENTLVLDDPNWEIPLCACFDWHGHRTAEGRVVHDGSAELTWHLEIPTPPADCFCETGACTTTVEQTLDATEL